MTVRLYKSTDASAPVLSGTVGALITVLDAVLVNGYGSQTAAGWTKPYSGTNTAQYRMAAGGTGCDLFINDAGPGAGGAKEARFCGFKTGSAIGAGSGQFPTSGQSSIGIGQLVIRKSTTADSTARAWTIIADGHTIYMFIDTGDPVASSFAQFSTYPWMFGDFFSYSASDTSNCAIIGRVRENTATFGTSTSSNTDWDVNAQMNEFFGAICGNRSDSLSYVIQGNFACANFTNVGGSIAIGKHTDSMKMGSPATTSSTLRMGAHRNSPGSSSEWVSNNPYPSPPDNGLQLAPVWIHHGGFVRGYFKGLWAPLQHKPMGHGDTYSGTGNLNSKSFIAMDILDLGPTASNFSSVANQYAAQVHVEYSDTWS